MIAAVVLAAISCKKDKEADSLPSLEGSLRFDCPSFVAPKQVVTMKPAGVKHPKGEEVGYFWKVTPTMKYNTATTIPNPTAALLPAMASI